MNLREILVLLREDGWYPVSQKGSHKQFKHPSKTGRVTVSDHGQDKDLAKGTINIILKQAGLKLKTSLDSVQS